MSKRDKQADELKAAIAGLEAQRSLLGHTVVEPALAALRQQLLQYRKIGSSYVIQRRYEKISAAIDAAEKALGGKPTEPAAEWWSEKMQIQMERMHLFYWQGMAKEMMGLAEEQRTLIEEKAKPIQRGVFFLMLGLSRLTRDRYVASEEALNFAQMAVSTSKGATDASDLPQLSHIQFASGFTHLWCGNLVDAAEQWKWRSRPRRRWATLSFKLAA
jgi:hypothetical protein